MFGGTPLPSRLGPHWGLSLPASLPKDNEETGRVKEGGDARLSEREDEVREVNN